MKSIRHRLLALLLTGTLLVLTAGGGAIYWLAHGNLLTDLEDDLRTRAHAIESMVSIEERGLVFEDSAVPGDFNGETQLEIRTRAGALLWQSSPDLAWPAAPDRIDEEPAFTDMVLPDGRPGCAVRLAIMPEVDEEEAAQDPPDSDDILLVPAGSDVETDVLMLTVALDRSRTDQALASLLLTLLAVGAGVGATITILVTAGVRWGLLPLDRLGRQLSRMDGATLSRRIDDSQVSPELAPICRELNDMLGRMEHTLERERAFADGAAHELRTPLTEMRAAIEVALRAEDHDEQRTLEELLAIGTEMERTVEALLLISRGFDHESPGAPADALDVAHRAVNRANGSLDRRRITVSITEPSNAVTIEAPAAALEIVVRNLVDNALRYTADDGSVAISHEHAHNGISAALVVENGPVDLVEDDLARIFEPFWRSDAARTDRRHVGLGLTVVQRVASAVGLAIDAGLSGDRLRMRVRRVDDAQGGGS